MSQKIYLVKYLLEDDIPVDETSENLDSTYLPEELEKWILDNNLIREIEIKESSGDVPDIPISTIDIDKINEVILFVESTILEQVQKIHANTSNNVHMSAEIDSNLNNLLDWLKVRAMLKEKETRYLEIPNIKIVVG